MTLERQRYPEIALTEVRVHLQVRDRFTFILRYELFTLFKTIFD